MIDQKKTRFAVQLGVLTVSRLFLNTGLRMVYPFLPAFSRGLGVPLVDVARLVSIRGFASLLSPIFGPLSEKYGRRPVLALSMIFFTAGCAVVIIWPDLWAFGLTLAAIALTKVIYDPAMQAYLGDTVAYEKRGRAISITELSWAGAFFLGVPLVGLSIKYQGWLAPFAWLGVMGILSAFMIWRALPAADGRSGQVTTLRATWKVIRRRPVIWAAAFYILLVMAANEIILIVYGDWMEVSFQLELGILGLATGVIGASEVVGELAIGVAVDRFGKRPMIIATGLLTSLMYLAIPFISVSLTAALAGLFLLFLAFEMTVVGGVPLMTELVPAARGVVMSMVLAAGGLGRGLGALIGPGLYAGDGLEQLGIVASVTMLVAVIVMILWIREGDANDQSLDFW